MKVGRPKRHLTRQQHIITSWYLARFCDPKGKLHVFGKGQMPRTESPAKACRERDFYEFETLSGPTNNQYEDWLGRLEGEARLVFPKIVERKTLTEWEASAWSAFIASTFIRTRKYRDHVSTAMTNEFRKRSQTSDFVRQLQYELFKTGVLHSETEVRTRVEQLRSAMESSESFYHVVGMPQHCRSLGAELIRRNWYTLDAAPGAFFLTSDCPVVTIERKERKWGLGSGFARPSTVVFFPLTPRKLFVISGRQFNWNPVVNTSVVDTVNSAIIQFAHKNVYASFESDELRFLVDRDINRIRFGDNAFLSPRNRPSELEN
jgi:hypothetical protein